MPFSEVMPKFSSGDLHSGSKTGPKVSNPKQAVAIMYSEKKAAGAGKTEYKAKKKPSLDGLEKSIKVRSPKI